MCRGCAAFRLVEDAIPVPRGVNRTLSNDRIQIRQNGMGYCPDK
jgi:hypothetical protein